jgi:hypothetical protein
VPLKFTQEDRFSHMHVLGGSGAGKTTLLQNLILTATILDMLALMDDPAPYEAAIAALPPIQRQFFGRDFKSKTFAQTREQIRYRLNAILENPTLARLFTAPKTKLDFFDALNNGSIILIDTAKDFLKGSCLSLCTSATKPNSSNGPPSDAVPRRGKTRYRHWATKLDADFGMGRRNFHGTVNTLADAVEAVARAIGGKALYERPKWFNIASAAL